MLRLQHCQRPLCTEACRPEAAAGGASAAGLANPAHHVLLVLWRGRKGGGRREEEREGIGGGEEARKEGRERKCYLWLWDTGRLVQGTGLLAFPPNEEAL